MMCATLPVIRLALPADLEALLAMELRHFSTDRLSRRSFQRLMQRPSASVWVVERSGVVFGDAVVLTRKNSLRARLYSIVIDRSAQGQGLGQLLLGQIEAQMKMHGFEEMHLEVRASDLATQHFYQQMGYVAYKRRDAYYADGEDAICMRHRLIP